MYTPLTHLRKHAELASPAYMGLEIILLIILLCINVCRTPVYAWISHLRLLVVWNYLNNYFATYTGLTSFRIDVELVSPAFFGLGIIQIIILPYINFRRNPVYAWNSHAPPSCC